VLHINQRVSHGGREVAAAATFGGTKNIAGREMAGAEAFTQHVGLRAFADAGHAEQDDAPDLACRLAGRHLALVVSALEPGGAVMMDEDADGVGSRKDFVNAHASNISTGSGKTKHLAQFCQNSSGFCQDLQTGTNEAARALMLQIV
jgi:hypothetical protein